MKATKEAAKMQPITLLQARAADRRRQASKSLTDTGQSWKNAGD
jgi:hypothetical protein